MATYFYDQYGSRGVYQPEQCAVYHSMGGSVLKHQTPLAIINLRHRHYGLLHNIFAIASGYASTRVNNFQILSDTLNRDTLSAIPSFAPHSVYSIPKAPSFVGDSLVINFDADTCARKLHRILNKHQLSIIQHPTTWYNYTRVIPTNQTAATIIVPRRRSVCGFW
jgi:hypothetical protein